MGLKLKKKASINRDAEYWHEECYKQWRENCTKNDAKFFILYKDFDKHLKEISSGALKLYLYYGFHAKNETGISWHSIETISNYFDVSEKSINNWNKELIERGLIYRKSKDNSRNKTTYLLPLTMTLFDKKKIEPEVFNSSDFNDVFGDVKKIFHLFQLRKGEGNEYDKPYHIAIVIFEKEFKDNIENTAVKVELNDDIYDLKKTIKSEITTEIATFKSDLKVPGFEFVKAQGIAVSTKYNLIETKTLYELVSELIDEKTDIDEYPSINLE